MKKNVKYLKLDRYEYNLLINALVEFKNKVKKEESITEPIDDLILKVIDSPVKRKVIEGR